MEEKKIDARKGGVTDTTFQTFIKIPQSLKRIVRQPVFCSAAVGPVARGP